MPSNINQSSYIESYIHDGTRNSNGSSRVNVRDYSNENKIRKSNVRSNSINFNFNDDDDEYDYNTNHNNNRNITRNQRCKSNMNINNDDYDDDDDYNTNHNNNRKSNTRSASNINLNSDQDYNNRNITRNQRNKSSMNVYNDDDYDNDEDYNRNSNRKNANSRNNINDNRSRRNSRNHFDDDEDFQVTTNRAIVRNSRPIDLSYAAPAVINPAPPAPPHPNNNNNNNNFDNDFQSEQTPRRNSTASTILTNTQSMQPINYEEFMLQRQSVLDQEREMMQKKMDEYFPLTFIVTYSFIFIVICLTIISLQITMIVFNVTLANIGAGIWCGVYFLIAVGLALSTVFHRQYSLMHASLVMHFFGMFLAIGGLVVVNIVALTRFNFCGSLYFNQNCANSALPGSHIAMVIFGCICFILCLVFFSYIQCSVFSSTPIGRSDPYGYLNDRSQSGRRMSFTSSRNSQYF
jgi:hypothetical protein